MQRFEPRKDTGSVLFSYLTCLHTTTSIFLSPFALVETSTAVLDDCDKRRLERAVKKLRSTNSNLSVMVIVQASGIDTNRANIALSLRTLKIGICIL